MGSTSEERANEGAWQAIKLRREIIEERGESVVTDRLVFLSAKFFLAGRRRTAASLEYYERELETIREEMTQ